MVSDREVIVPCADDERYMRMAIDQAIIAEENGDVTIGGVIVFE